MKKTGAHIVGIFIQLVGGAWKKGYLNNVAVLTIALSVFIVSAFLLFLINANDAIGNWKQGVRMMVYLVPQTDAATVEMIKTAISGMDGVTDVVFVPREKGLAYLKEQLAGQLSLFSELDENPLPDAFDVQLDTRSLEMADIAGLAEKIQKEESVESVEYGQIWLHRFVNFFKLFHFAAVSISGLFFMASVFIIGNTIRLMLFARRDEIEIMRLVGASENFIKKPFYLEGLAMGLVGGLLGIVAVYIVFLAVSSGVVQTDAARIIQIRFFPFSICTGIVFSSVFVGWLGCAISLSRYFKE